MGVRVYGSSECGFIAIGNNELPVLVFDLGDGCLALGIP